MFCRFCGAVALCFASLAILSCNTDTAVPAHKVAFAMSDPNALVNRCGEPDIDDSSVHDNPRPLIAARVITYKMAHLTFIYIPGRGAAPNAEPLTLMGITDIRTNKAIPVAQHKVELSNRLPCAVSTY